MASSALEKTEEERKYIAFRSKVKRTVYVDNISPKVEKEALMKSFEQHGNVVEVEFIPTYREWIPFPEIPSKRALVVMENEQQAKNVVDTLNEYPFMICGMPRPVRAFPAVAKMFPFRPPPNRKIMCSWIGPDDPNFARARKEKELVMKHSLEVEFLHYCQQQEEEKLAEKQEQALRADMKKYTTLEKVIDEKSVGRLAKAYNLDLSSR